MIHLIKKCLVLVISVTACLSLSVHAEETGAGCGVGKIAMEGKSGKDAAISASLINLIVNYFTGAQLFGMTSGTLGCDTSQQVNNHRLKDEFVAQNQDSLTIDIARGEGAYLESFASIIGVKAEDKALFFDHLQANYDEIADTDDMIASIDHSLAKNPLLNKYTR